jgi:hypothetical protein
VDLFDEPQLPLISAVDAVAVSAHYVWAEGWTLTISTRRQVDQWGDTPPEQYTRLTTPELADTIAAVVSSRLGL